MQFCVGKNNTENVLAGHATKVEAGVSNGVYKAMDFDIHVGNDNEIFSSH